MLVTCEVQFSWSLSAWRQIFWKINLLLVLAKHSSTSATFFSVAKQEDIGRISNLSYDSRFFVYRPFWLNFSFSRIARDCPLSHKPFRSTMLSLHKSMRRNRAENGSGGIFRKIAHRYSHSDGIYGRSEDLDSVYQIKENSKKMRKQGRRHGTRCA